MKLVQSSVFAFVLGLLAIQGTYASCPKVNVTTTGTGWSWSESKEEAKELALEMATEDSINSCLGMIAARCRFAGCSIPKNVKEPTTKASVDFCYGDDDEDWTCIADSDAKCSAKCE